MHQNIGMSLFKCTLSLSVHIPVLIEYLQSNRILHLTTTIMKQRYLWISLVRKKEQTDDSMLNCHYATSGNNLLVSFRWIWTPSTTREARVVGIITTIIYTRGGQFIIWNVLLQNILAEPKGDMLQIMFQQMEVGYNIFIVRYIFLNKQTLSNLLLKIFSVLLHIIQICITCFNWREKYDI